MNIYQMAHLTTPVTPREFTFPDGQPHINVEDLPNRGAYDGPLIKTSLRNAQDVLNLLMAKDVLDRKGYTHIDLTLGYLLGARMDRPIDIHQPFTLKIIANLINSCGFERVRVFDPHSTVSLALLNNSEAISPLRYVNQTRDAVLQRYRARNVVLIAPDAGAAHRVHELAQGAMVVQCLKHRDSRTGKLSGFQIYDTDGLIERSHCLIVDDICDGGRTFVELASLLRKYGAAWVGLYASHGIFSKGLPLRGIDHIWTTSSYWQGPADDYLTVMPF